MSNKECGCGHEHEHEHDDCCCGHHHDHPTVVISLDGETDLTCSVIGSFDVNEQAYIALQPVDEDEVLIFRYSEENDEVRLDNIESDEEYEAVAEVFYSLFDEDFDEDFDMDFDDDDDSDEDDLDDDSDEDAN